MGNQEFTLRNPSVVCGPTACGLGTCVCTNLTACKSHERMSHKPPSKACASSLPGPVHLQSMKRPVSLHAKLLWQHHTHTHTASYICRPGCCTHLELLCPDKRSQSHGIWVYARPSNGFELVMLQGNLLDLQDGCRMMPSFAYLFMCCVCPVDACLLHVGCTSSLHAPGAVNATIVVLK